MEWSSAIRSSMVKGVRWRRTLSIAWAMYGSWLYVWSRTVTFGSMFLIVAIALNRDGP